MDLTSNPEWASLPTFLLDSILDYLVPMEDYVTFSEVCIQWQEAVSEKLEDLKSNHRRYCNLHQKVPLLLAPTCWNEAKEQFCFYDVLRRKSVIEFKFRLGSRSRRSCEGCYHGWLILVDIYQVTLFNPFSEKQILLPPLERSISQGFDTVDPPPRRPALSADPNANRDDFVIMMRHTSYVKNKKRHINDNKSDSDNGIKHMIAFIRSGDRDWTYKELPDVEDIVYKNGLFYLLHRSGVLSSCDVQSNSGYKLRQISPHSPPNPDGNWDSYLVESPGGDLLRVIKKCWDGFVVYKLVWLDSMNQIWEEVMSLGDVALFLGENHSISVTASDFLGCQSNCIYYSQRSVDFDMHSSDLSSSPIHDEGSAYFFSLNDKTITKLYPLFIPDRRQPLLWISKKIV